jgi:hypothetical protein
MMQLELHAGEVTAEEKNEQIEEKSNNNPDTQAMETDGTSEGSMEEDNVPLLEQIRINAAAKSDTHIPLNIDSIGEVVPNDSIVSQHKKALQLDNDEEETIHMVAEEQNTSIRDLESSAQSKSKAPILLCDDGHVVGSNELRLIDNWLYHNDFVHGIKTKYPGLI